MAGKSPHQAIKAFVEPISRSVHCFTRANLRPTDYPSIGEGPALLILNNAQPVRLDSDRDIHLSATQWFEVVEAQGRRRPFKVQTTGYQYDILVGFEREETFAYHWHPHTNREEPHLHVEAQTADFSTSKIHVPTGRIAIEHALILAHELGAEPIRGDWEDVVFGSLEKFERWRTWS